MAHEQHATDVQALRDASDGPWYAMTEEERDEVRNSPELRGDFRAKLA